LLQRFARLLILRPAVALTAVCAPRAGFAGEDASMLDSIERRLPALESRARSTLMFGGSSPISFSGEARVKAQYHNFVDYPLFMEADRAYVQTGWEGNENLFRLGMVVRAGRNTVLWSKIGFQHTMAGNVAATPGTPGGNSSQGFEQTQSRHDKANVTASIHEDLSAGIALRTRPASFWARMGNVLWTEASPLTIWKDQPRTFAWEYLPFEIEQPITRYYEYNMARGEKTGRAAWNKKPFNGLGVESINLPADLYVNVLYAAMERYDNFEREYVDFANDLALANAGDARKGQGIGDSYRKLFHVRIAKKRIGNGLSAGVSLNSFHYRSDFVHAAPTNSVFGVDTVTVIDTIFDARTRERIADTSMALSGRLFYKEPRIVSADLRGAVSDIISMHADVAASRIDTTWVSYDSSLTYTRHRRSSAIIPALYASLGYDGKMPIEADIAVLPRGFYSPLSFVAPADAFYAFGSNMLGAGKFIARGEGSPYVQNMAGALVTVTPRISGYGHLKARYGQHFQMEPARDLLYFPYRLNGQDLFSVFHSSYNRWGNGLVDHSIAQSGSRWFESRAERVYDKRIGDESHRRYADNLQPMGPDAGGLHSDYLTMYESFVPYESEAQATANVNDSTGIYDRSPHVPVHRKWTFNVDVDAAYDIGPLVGYTRDFFVGGYASINGVSTKPRALAFNEQADDMLLWSLYLRLEPAIQCAEKLYVIGLLGYENWRAAAAYQVEKMSSTSAGEQARAYLSPIDYRDVAYGVGFDWDVLERTGLHGRLKWMSHTDRFDRDNDWATPIVSLELKTWF
jgi:hypothetical protein